MLLFKEFKEFAMGGNVVDMAVGVIIGVSFGKIITSLVNDVLMPPLGLIIGGVDFSQLKIDLGDSKAGVEAAAIKYGAFINTVIDFVIVALVIFLMLKAIRTLKRAPAAAAIATKGCPDCCSVIPIKAKRCAHCTSILPT